jgi:hypothetical protein
MTNVNFQLYSNFFFTLFNKETDLNSDDIRIALVTSSYTIDRIAHDYWNDVVANELATASGYTANGLALTTEAFSIIAANSWTKVAATSTAYNVGEIVRPSAGNLFVYRCSVAGTSGGSAPTWPTTVGLTVADGSVTWTCVGRSVARFTSDPAVWAAAFDAGPFRYAVMYNRSPATDATRPLIGVITYGSDQTGGSGSFTLTPDADAGWIAIPIE